MPQAQANKHEMHLFLISDEVRTNDPGHPVHHTQYLPLPDLHHLPSLPPGHASHHSDGLHRLHLVLSIPPSPDYPLLALHGDPDTRPDHRCATQKKSVRSDVVSMTDDIVFNDR